MAWRWPEIGPPSTRGSAVQHSRPWRNTRHVRQGHARRSHPNRLAAQREGEALPFGALLFRRVRARLPIRPSRTRALRRRGRGRTRSATTAWSSPAPSHNVRPKIEAGAGGLNAISPPHEGHSRRTPLQTPKTSPDPWRPSGSARQHAPLRPGRSFEVSARGLHPCGGMAGSRPRVEGTSDPGKQPPRWTCWRTRSDRQGPSPSGSCAPSGGLRGSTVRLHPRASAGAAQRAARRRGAEHRARGGGAARYRWCREFGGPKSDQVKRLKNLEVENGRLGKAFADHPLGANQEHRAA